MKLILVITLFALAVPTSAPCDTINTVSAELRALVDEPFRYGVAQDLAANLLEAQAIAPYASEESLDLSIEAVVRAIGIDGTAYVGFANMDPITWIQSDIAIDPSASIGITPSALYFGSQPVVATPEPEVWLMLLAVALVIGGACGWLWLRGPMKPAALEPPILSTEFGPVTEWARKQAAANMLADPDLRARVFEVVLSECHGDAALATVEFSRRYPELGEMRVGYEELL